MLETLPCVRGRGAACAMVCELIMAACDVHGHQIEVAIDLGVRDVTQQSRH